MTLTPADMKSRSLELLQDVNDLMRPLAEATESVMNDRSSVEKMSLDQQFAVKAIYTCACYSSDVVRAVALLIANDLAEQGFAIVRPVCELTARLAWSSSATDGWCHFLSRTKAMYLKVINDIRDHPEVARIVQEKIDQLPEGPSCSGDKMPDTMYPIIQQLRSFYPDTLGEDWARNAPRQFYLMNRFAHADLNQIQSPPPPYTPLLLAYLLVHTSTFLVMATCAFIPMSDRPGIQEKVRGLWEKSRRFETEQQT